MLTTEYVVEKVSIVFRTKMTALYLSIQTLQGKQVVDFSCWSRTKPRYYTIINIADS